ncbi:ADP-ribose 1''-phosphate phosphatase [Marasmius crinis-equi]|uniref:ADP-ribose 1''-phosphate phosphatase n=1 Tax=Marasmius crinis-equi TaxID=585013 RepID=A0ABR3FNZ3_9AGAR
MSLITHITGDLFTAPAGSILVHACNTVGSWGGGIAVTFKQHFPSQFETYKAHCEAHEGRSLIGTCLLIPGDVHDVACLFTSRAYGKRKDKPDEILDATRKAVLDLVKQNEGNKELHACRFNSGKFGVPWEDTEKILQELGVRMTIYTPQ